MRTLLLHKLCPHLDVSCHVWVTNLGCSPTGLIMLLLGVAHKFYPKLRAFARLEGHGDEVNPESQPLHPLQSICMADSPHTTEPREAHHTKAKRRHEERRR